MTITVEDRTGLATADAFVSVAYCDTYHAARGNTAWAAASTADKETAIVRATQYLSEAYAWQGLPINQRSQSLAWPRTYVTDSNGYAVPSNAVPGEIEQATALVALAELADPGVMAPSYTAHSRVKSEKVGPLAVEYDLSRTDAEGARPVILAVRDIVGGLLLTGAGSLLSGQSVRV